MMKSLVSILLLSCISVAFTQTAPSAGPFIPSFAIEPNDLELSRLAQPYQYFDKIGRRAGIMGFESGTFEAWVWPWKPLRNFELSFLLGTSTQPVLAKDIVRTISVTPEATTITYTYESFSVKELIVVPREEPGIILLLDVHTTADLSIIASFLPVMQPMWPAGIGGQFSYWDDDAHAYVISEGRWRAGFLCGSPAGEQMAAPPAHMFADNPLQFRIVATPKGSGGKFIPIVIAGAVPDTATQRMNMDSVKATYERLWKNAGRYYGENCAYYRDLRTSTLQLDSPDRELNLAFEWGKVALDNLFVTNPRLGTGMVAGFGLSGGGARPGFAWFFGGDAFINVMTLNSVGMFKQSRDALAFTQKWQREENFPVRKKNASDPPKDVGKMAHELSQSDGDLCDWWNDYHYGYNHADTTPWYIVAMADYVRTSGDVEFLRRSWSSVKKAYAWCLSKDSDADGLMDLKGAGLGALEFGKLVGIYADVYTCGVWVQAVKEMRYMAEAVGDAEMSKDAAGQLAKAQPQLEKKFWLEKEGYYSYGATEKGEQVHEKTPWSGVAMMFGLLDSARSRRSIEAFNRADMCADWGVRSLANTSPLFEPTNYNYGAVWPFISSFFNTAQFRNHFALAGFQILKANLGHAFDHGLGVVPEVFSGELNEKLGEAYHHQGFSTTGYLFPLVRGLLGMQVDARNRSVVYTPRLPAGWDHLRLRNLRVGDASVDLGLSQSDSSTALSLLSARGEAIRVRFAPERSGELPSPVTLDGPAGSAVVPFRGRVAVIVPPAESAPGASNAGLRVIAERYEGKEYRLSFEGMSGETYKLPLLNRELVGRVEGGTIEGGSVAISFESAPGRQFARKELVMHLK